MIKFLPTSGLSILSTSVGINTRLSPAEAEAWLYQMVMHGDFLASSTDQLALPDGIDVQTSYLWNYPNAPFGNPKPEPLPGLVVTLAASDITKVIGAQIQMDWTFDYQVASGYQALGPKPPSVKHSALLQINKESAVMRVAVIPAQVVNGGTRLALPYIGDNGFPGATIKLSGLPPGVTANVRVLTRYEMALHELFPEVANEVSGLGKRLGS